MERLNFCNLFDSNYLTRGLAMYESLTKSQTKFHLYIYAFDNITLEILGELNLPNLTVISLREFESPELLSVKVTRTPAEYCWTCTPSIIQHSIETYKLDHCTYIDADLYFYSNPKVLVEEMGSNSVLITEHRYSPEYDQMSTSGKYCVQFMTFKNDVKGMHVLHWWKNECIKWCFSRYEDGKFGDQKYLDDWATRFEGVHELKHLGGGVAPWNLQQYIFTKKNKKIYLKKPDSGEFIELVFFHFHHLKFFLNDVIKITSSYSISRKVLVYLYFPYINKLMEMKKQIAKKGTSFDPNGAKEISPCRPYLFRDKIHLYKQAILKFSYKKLVAARKNIHAHDYFFLHNIK